MRSAGFVMILVAAALGGCAGDTSGPFAIASGSENRSLEPIVQEFCADQGVTCRFEWLGSVDIGLSLAGGAVGYDAVWPANGIWIDLYDGERKVQHLEPIARSPVILGVRLAKAKELNWIGRNVTAAEIVAAVRAGRFRFLASSATQSHSGAGAFLAMLSAALGHPDAVTPEDLKNPAMRETMQALLAGTVRTAGSSAWLADLYVQSARENAPYDGMWNYEAVIAETNEILKGQGHEPLYAIYPADGVALANSPLGFVDRGRGPATRAFFDDLQKHLLSAGTQQRLVAHHRRPAIGDAPAGRGDPQTNYDPSRFVTLVRMPGPEVIRTALGLYQDVLRRPSLTVYCLDYSGSMTGNGEANLEQALDFILTPPKAAKAMVQHGGSDRIVVIPFDNAIRRIHRGSGDPVEQARLLKDVRQQAAEGGTAMHACAARGLAEIEGTADRDAFLPAIVIMTDGRSQDSPDAFLGKWRSLKFEVPVFGITFGDADRGQLDALATATRGRVFDGATSLIDAFRAVRGYN